MRILVADQDAEHRHALVSYLLSLGHSPEESLSSREVIEYCRGKCPDLIFIDLMISGVSGIDVVRQIRQLGGHAIWVPIIMLGMKFSDQEILQGIDAGADDFLVKPLPNLKVLTKIRSAERHMNLKEEIYSLARNLVVANRALESIATQDTLTGVGNSNSFDDAIERDWFEAKRTNTPLSLLVTNIDFFQQFNQAYGAATGDETLKKIAESFKKNITQKGSSIARLVGDTFAILIPNTNREAGLKIAQLLHKAIFDLQIPHSTSGCSDRVTISVGLSVAEPEHYTSPWDLKEAADFALYQAKHHGRNRVAIEPAVAAKTS